MRAVNLLPSDLRGTAPASAPSARPEPAEGIGAYVVLGALALCVSLLAVYVLAGNNVKQKQSDLAGVTAQADAANRKVAQLKPYADFDAQAKARVETVRGLAAARFDWEKALRDLSRAMPKDVKLQNLSGDMGLPGGTASGGDPLRGSIQAPAISLSGCATSQPGVARLMARLRAVNGVTRVSLSKSEKPSTTTTTGAPTSACSGKTPPSFSVVVFFERSAALAALAPATPQAATASSVPVPSAVSGTQAGSKGSAAGNSAQAQAGGKESGGTSTSTTTTSSGADAP